jgi:hypothetical protein
VIRENLGCPQEVRLIFNRAVTRKHTGQFRARIVAQDVTPALAKTRPPSGLLPKAQASW